MVKVNIMRNRIIVAGSRNYTNYAFVKEKLDSILMGLSDVEIICGDCRGADMLGKRYADEHNIPVEHFPADWDTHGKAAGPIRNTAMAKYAVNDAHGILVAFWDGKSRGTKNMIETASRYGCDIYKFMI